ncbi:hypothetical protein FBQ83_01185 [Chloroflexi bacterium CFX5]|nr:hypothetical protein [Anaerolineales bacterium]MDL1917922.1 hypothetical protein [Chloroflexi bacterium CFX5]NUQ59164.1 hypothetical protein [Anaerolineales bacterium]
MAKKIDGVIEAVRHKSGQIAAVRAYERRGFTFSDRLTLDRKTLLERLQKGMYFVTGSRRELMASTFDLFKPVQIAQAGGREFISTKENASCDELENVPFF